MIFLIVSIGTFFGLFQSMKDTLTLQKEHFIQKKKVNNFIKKKSSISVINIADIYPCHDTTSRNILDRNQTSVSSRHDEPLPRRSVTCNATTKFLRCQNDRKFERSRSILLFRSKSQWLLCHLPQDWDFPSEGCVCSSSYGQKSSVAATGNGQNCKEISSQDGVKKYSSEISYIKRALCAASWLANKT